MDNDLPPVDYLEESNSDSEPFNGFADAASSVASARSSVISYPASERSNSHYTSGNEADNYSESSRALQNFDGISVVSTDSSFGFRWTSSLESLDSNSIQHDHDVIDNENNDRDETDDVGVAENQNVEEHHDNDVTLNPSQNRQPVNQNLFPEETNSDAIITENSNQMQYESENIDSQEVTSPPTKVQKLEKDTDVTNRRIEEDGETCSICLDSWSNAGEHRIVSLKCGHLFGQSCVVRWLQTQSARERSCPTCKTKASARDIRFIYARKLIAADTTEVDALKEQLQKTKQDKVLIESKLNTLVLMQGKFMDQITTLKTRIRNLESQMVGTSQQNQIQRKREWRFALDKTIEVSKDSGCRVLTYNCRKYELCVSQKSANTLFPGFGIRKINCVDYRLGQFVFLHPKMIRDLKYSQQNDMILSVSLDKTAKLSSGQNNVVTHTINAEIPLWSCCWDLCSSDRLFVGGVGGTTLVYDTRQLSVPVEKLTIPTNDSPVASLASTPNGILSCQLTSCWFYYRNGSAYAPFMLPIDGPFSSLSYEEQSKQILISTRPTNNKPVRHVVGYLSDDSIDFNTLHMFEGSKMQSLMSRSCQIRLGSDNWVAAYNESGSTVSLFNVNSFTTSQSLPMQEPVIDTCPISFNGQDFLATLSQNKARIYKALDLSSLPIM